MSSATARAANLLSWWQQIPYFSKSYRCITFSHRGFGHSYDVPGAPGMKSFVEDLVGLLDHLEVDSVHLVSQSMGGRTALGFAVEHTTRTRSLVLADTTGAMGEPGGRAGSRRLEGATDIAARTWLPSVGRRLQHTRTGAGKPVPTGLPHQPTQAADRRSLERRFQGC